MKNLKLISTRTASGAALAALVIAVGLMAAPASASAAQTSQRESTETSGALINGPIIDLGDLLGDINIGQFQ
ncbi:hypothetical protein ACPUD8_16065 [Brevibacterium sp. FAM 25378]|uniref:hypothetical protein n=1 Tax=unclassified Brevibacterium TaxID=2614124 RepID=UPI001091BE85|nr:hypothetical protein [Brevibacterium sp. S22]TGD29721.1 hypothetical protein EB835_15795 [Brevibacterium sp. S22]